MRKIIVLSMITIDGVMQAPNGPEEDTSVPDHPSGFRQTNKYRLFAFTFGLGFSPIAIGQTSLAG